MSRISCWAVAAVPLWFLGWACALAADDSVPHWIWSRETSELKVAADQCRLERSFRVEEPLQSAKLRFAADFCDATVEINGQGVVSVLPYSSTMDVDATAAVKLGENRIAISAKSVEGPVAVALNLTLIAADGKQTTIVTDEQWNAKSEIGKEQAAVSLGAVDAALWGLGRRPATIDPFDNYEQWRQALGTKPAESGAAFWTAPGFEISLVRSAQPDEGSWVSMAFDPQGRLTIAREDKGLLRMTLDEPRRSVTRVETINEDLQECRGLLYAFGALYASANNSKGLYRLRDIDGDDKFDEVKLLREFPGGPGHGRNDLALGPDGLIYAIHGDAVDVPRENINDHTSPFREARRGLTTKEGHVVRTDRDGRKWELLCGGLRNPFGIAFNPSGDLFTYDADAEFDMGSPWYRPTRVVQVVSGADYGWRGITGKWPPYFANHPDNGLPTLDIGKGSPTAVMFGSDTKFPADYRRALFILDWAYGRILAVHLAPRGAGYRAQAETFLKGRPLNVTDLATGPDGAMYIVTGGRKTQSALYRIAYTGNDLADRAASPHEVACQKHAEAARKLRLSLENGSEANQTPGPAAVWSQLAAADPLIRHAARIAVERQPVKTWRELVLAEARPAAVLTGLMALARSGDKGAVPAIVERQLRFAANDLDIEQTLMLVQTYSLCLQLSPDAVMAKKSPIVAQLDPLFQHSATQWLHVSPSGTGSTLQRDLARLLVQLSWPAAVEKISQSLLVSAVQEDRLHALFLLRNVRTGWTPETRRVYFTALREGGSFLGGEGMPKFLAQIREEALATLSESERRDLADLLAPATGSAENGALPPARAVVRQWTLDDFLPLLSDSSRAGDTARGAAVFRDALCVRCHRAGARGPAVGPDLTHVAGRFSQRDILESILTPSKVVAENYRNIQVLATDGRVIVGRVLAEGDFRAEKLRMATDPLRPGVVVELNKREIDQVRESETSPMPQGLLDSFRPAEVLDLLAFLMAGANVELPAAGKRLP